MARQPVRPRPRPRAHTEDAVLAILATAVEKAGSANKWGAGHRFSSAYVREVLSGTKPVSDRLLAALGLQRRTAIVPVGEDLR